MVATVIQAPQSQEVPYGLIDSADPSPAQNTDARWENGFGFVPETCTQPESWVIPCVGTGSTAGPGATITENRGDGADYLEWAPYVLRAQYKCDLVSKQAIDFEDRARRILEAGQSKLLETELSRGDAAGYGQSVTNPARTNYNLTLTARPTGTINLPGTGGGESPALAIRTLLQAAAQAPNGARGMIHATPATVMAWMQGGALMTNRAGRLVTRVGGHTVVYGSGYTGEGPNNASIAATPTIHWAWITSPVYLLLGDIEILDATTKTSDWRNNDGDVIVQRTACAYWDGCLHAGVPVDTMGTSI